MNETKFDGLVGAGADVERLEREARVSDPGEAVVPVALAADRLRQRGGGCGDDRAGRRVGEPLQHARAEADQLAVGPLVDVVLGLPRPPGLGGVLRSARAPARAAPAQAVHPRRRPSAGERCLFAGREPERRAHRSVRDVNPAVGAHGDLVRAAERAPPRPRSRESAGARARTPAGVRAHHHLDFAVDAFDEPQQLVRRVVSEVVPALALGEAHRIGHARSACRGRGRWSR